MRRTEAREAVRMAVFLNILNRWESAELNQEEAAELLGVSERTFRRWTRRYEDEGEAGLIDRRLSQASGKRVPSDRAEEVERLYRERYQGFAVKHFHEHRVKDHGFGSWLHLAQAASAMGGRRAEGAAQGGIGGSASGAGRRGGGCCRTARATNGSKASPPLISLSRSMTRRERSIRPFWSKRKARPWPSGR